MSTFLMFLFNEFRGSVILKWRVSFDQMRGRIYFIEFLPNLIVSNYPLLCSFHKSAVYITAMIKHVFISFFAVQILI